MRPSSTKEEMTDEATEDIPYAEVEEAEDIIGTPFGLLRKEVTPFSNIVLRHSE